MHVINDQVKQVTDNEDPGKLNEGARSPEEAGGLGKHGDEELDGDVISFNDDHTPSSHWRGKRMLSGVLTVPTGDLLDVQERRIQHEESGED
ncbi:hypothetical protein PG996_006594 [Apiospora saccharicola]|uniref:Uncharacterized protein n=1 Tax=Apiospora saccharicola TaxID=335842 RepID=A0ABR1V8H3_9PEZI